MTGERALQRIWDTEYRTCRFCKKNEDSSNMVKYGTRHYAHHECFLNGLGTDGLSRLNQTQLERFPKALARKHNVHVFLKMCLNAERAENAK